MKKKFFITNIIFFSTFLISFIITPFNYKAKELDEDVITVVRQENYYLNNNEHLERQLFDLEQEIETEVFLEINFENNEKEIDLVKESKIEIEAETKVELTEKQIFVLENSKNKISGNSIIFGNVKDISIIDYIIKVSKFLESETNVNIDSYMVLALLAQESRLNPNVNGDGIAQIYIGDDVYCVLNDGGKLIIPINNKRDAVRSIEWTMVSYVGNYQRLLEYRTTISEDASISPLYIFKLHNSGNNLRIVRGNYSETYPLTKEGDEAFIKTFEEFESEGLEMFKSYLKISGADSVLKKIHKNMSYEEYVSSGRLFSDPRYIKNVQEYYVKEVD